MVFLSQVPILEVRIKKDQSQFMLGSQILLPQPFSSAQFLLSTQWGRKINSMLQI